MKFACDERALIYIAGYVSFKCGSKTSCMACKAALVSERDLAVDTVDLCRRFLRRPAQQWWAKISIMYGCHVWLSRVLNRSGSFDS